MGPLASRIAESSSQEDLGPIGKLVERQREGLLDEFQGVLIDPVRFGPTVGVLPSLYPSYQLVA